MKSTKRPERFTESQVQNQEFLASTQPSKIDRIRSNIHPKVNVLPPNSLPLWKDYPLDKKFPKVPANDDKFVFARNQIGQSVFVSSPRQKFDNEDPRLQATPTGYTSLHDPHLKEYFENHPKVFDRLVKEGLVDPEDGGVKTDMKAFNEYRAYLARLRNTELDDEVRTQNKFADAQNQQLKRIKTDATNSDRKRKHEQKAQALNALKRDRAARELRNQLKEFKQANGMVAAEKARQDAEAALKREMLRDKVRGRLAKLRRAERRRARKLILEFYCKQLYADMLRNAIREHKKKERHADLESFVDAKREFQTVKMEYMKALEEKRKAEKECHVNARMKHFEHVENHRIENLKKRVLQAERAAEREAYLLKKFGMRWLNAVRQQRDNAKTYHESVWHVRQQLMVMVKELKKESGKVSFTNFIHGLVSLRPGAAEPLPKMSEETKAIMNYILDLLIQTALEEYKKQHEKCKEAYAKQARRRDILGKPHLTEKDFEPPPYSPREKPVIPFERPTFPCKHPCTDIKPWMKEHGSCNECEENEDEYDEAYDMVDEELRRIMGIATPREQEAIREIVGSDSSGEAEGVVSSSIKKSVEKLGREGLSTKDVSSNTRPMLKQTRKPEVRQERAAPKEKAKPASTPPSSDSSAVAEQAAKLAIKNSLAKLAEEPTESEGSSAVAEKVVSKSLTNVQADLEKPKEPEVLRKSEVEDNVEPDELKEEPLETHEPEEEQQETPKDDVSEGSSGVAEELVRKSLSNVTSGMLKESASKLVEQPPAQQALKEEVKEPLKEPLKEEVKKLDEPGERLSAQETKPDDRAPDTDTKANDTQKEEVLKQEPVKDKEELISPETKPEEKEKKPEESKVEKEPEESKLSDKKPVDKEEQQEKQAPGEAKGTDQKLDKPPIDQQQGQPTEGQQQGTDEPKAPKEPLKQEAQAPEEVQKQEAQAIEEPAKQETQAPEEAQKEETQAPEEAQAHEEPPKQEALEEEEPPKEEPQALEEALKEEPPKQETQSPEETLRQETPKEEAQSPEESRQDPDKQEAQALEELQREEPEKHEPEPPQDEHPTEDNSKPGDEQPVVRDNEPASKESEDVSKGSIQDDKKSVDDSTDKLVNKSASQDSSKRETLDESSNLESKQEGSELEPEEDESVKETDTSQDGAKPDDARQQTDDAIQETQDTEMEGKEEDDTPNQYVDEEQIPETQTSQPDQHDHEQVPEEKKPTYEEEQEAVPEPSESVIEGRSLEPLDSCTSYASSSTSSSTASNLVSRSLQNAADSLKCKEAPVHSSTQEINYDSCGEPSSTGSSSTSDPSDIVKKSILKAVESLTCKELDSCDSLSELSVSSGEAEGIVAKALARVVESLRCGSQGDGPEHLTRIRKSSVISHDTVQAFQMGGYVSVQNPGQDTLDHTNSQARSHVGQTGSGELGPQGRALQTSGDPQMNESRASQAYFPDNTTGAARASGPPQRPSQARNIGQTPFQAANLRQGSYQATSLDQGSYQATSLDQGPSQARNIGQAPYQVANLDKGPSQAANLTQRNEPGVVHRYETGLIESGDCDSVINEMAKAVVKSILPQGLFTRYSFTDESVSETQPPPPQVPATQPEAPTAVMPQDLRDSVLRTLSNVQEQLDAIRHELQIHGVIP